MVRGRAEISLSLEAVATSPALARSPALRKLLLYLAERRTEELSEYAIGVDVFSKRADFDPRFDATVRVQIARLRQKLREHYEKHAQGETRRFVIPAGTHCLELQEVEGPQQPAAFPLRRLLWAGVLAILLLTVGFLGWRNADLQKELAGRPQQPPLPELWQTLLSPTRLTRIVYPIPVFYQWDRLRVRDVGNNEPEGWRTSAVLAPLIQKLGPPQSNESYSVASDTAAAMQLTRFLSQRNIPMEVSPTGSLSLDQYGSDNLVFLGFSPTNSALDSLVKDMNFQLKSGGGVVGNAHPQASEASEWAPSRESDASQVRYGIIASVPGQAADSRLVLILGLHTSSLATALTAPPSLAALTQKWASAGRPKHFEAVIQAEVIGHRLRAARPLALRAIPAKH